MKISQVISVLETKAPLAYQEDYDNCGLIIGDSQKECTGIICTLDATVEVIREAKNKGCNLVVAHHPIIFKGLKKITGKNDVEQAIIEAIKFDIAIYAIHTNLDNMADGVNLAIAQKIGLINTRVLLPKRNELLKLITFAPLAEAEKIRKALFNAGAGNIGEYSEVSFNADGMSSFKGSAISNPTIGKPGILHREPETRIEVILPAYLQQTVLEALFEAHIYEEVAYDLVPLLNENRLVGSGMMGELPVEMAETDFLRLLMEKFGLSVIKHTPFLKKPVQKIALCGGAGSFLIPHAKAAGADIYISSDFTYHTFFDAENQLILADIGHWESEQYTTHLLFAFLTAKFPNFAVLKTAIHTNPVRYFLG